MIPFLSVYETRATESLLELFWETATTGLISDLNTDVLTGFDGPAGFLNVDYAHFEWQNPNGLNVGPTSQGLPDSKYITGEFFVVDQLGFPIINTTVTLTSVFNNESPPVARLNDFDIEPVIGSSPSQYRLKIKPPPTGAPFVFNHNAADKESYIFTFNVVDNSDPTQPISSILTINGRLKNNPPIITTIDVNYSIVQDTTTFATLEAVNGAYFDPLGPPPIPPTNVKSDLKWTIIGGDTTVPSFSITPYGGVLSLENHEIPLGTYVLEIKVEDAVDIVSGQPLLPLGELGTLSDTIFLNVNVGDAPMPYWLRPDYASTSLYTSDQCGGDDEMNYYGMVYLGKNPNPSNAYLPVIPGKIGNYSFINNVEVKNANGFGYPTIDPTGLTQGEYRFKIKLNVNAIEICGGGGGGEGPSLDAAASIGEVEIYLYKRQWAPAPSPFTWTLVNNENNFGVPNLPAVLPYKIGPLVVSTIYDQFTGQTTYGDPKMLTTSFTIEAEEELQEYAVGVRLLGKYGNGFGFGGQVVQVFGNDANYSYPQVEPFLPAQTNDYSYYTGVEVVGTNYTSGVPYATLDAARGIYYNSQQNLIASGTVFSNSPTANLTLASVNSQIVAGLSCALGVVGVNINNPIYGKIVYVDPANPTQIMLQFDGLTWPYATSDLSQGNLAVTTGNFDPAFPTGRLYANTEEGTEIKRFYTDAAFTQKWIPPIADKYYNFITAKNYNPDGIYFLSGDPVYSEFPYYCARINGDGEVVDAIPQTPNVQTAWAGQNTANTSPIPIANYSYNVLYEEHP
jgi:hypothetical protein